MTTGERKRRRFPRGIRNVRALFCAPVEGLSVSVCEFVPHGRVDCHSVCGLKLRYPLLLPETEERGAVSDGVSLVFRTASGTEYGGSTTNNGINDSAATRGGGGGEVIGAGGGGRRVASSATRYCRPKQRKGEPYGWRQLGIPHRKRHGIRRVDCKQSVATRAPPGWGGALVGAGGGGRTRTGY